MQRFTTLVVAAVAGMAFLAGHAAVQASGGKGSPGKSGTSAQGPRKTGTNKRWSDYERCRYPGWCAEAGCYCPRPVCTTECTPAPVCEEEGEESPPACRVVKPVRIYPVQPARRPPPGRHITENRGQSSGQSTRQPGRR